MKTDWTGIRLTLLVAGLCLGLVAGVARAADVYVDVSWMGTQSGTQTEPFRTISNAVFYANSGAPGTRSAPATYNVRIAAGTYRDIANGGLEDYSEPVNPVESDPVTGGGYKLGWATLSPDEAVLVNLYGGYAGWDGEGSDPGNFDWTEGSRVPRSTIIDLQGASSRAFYNNHGTHTSWGPLFDGLTIRNANTTGDGGAILSRADFMVYERINNCLFTNNVASGQGGAVRLGVDMKGYIRDSEFVDNQGTAGGAVFVSMITQISDTIFRGNKGTVGGALTIDQTPGANVILRCTFENNQASGNGGAFYGRTAGTTRPYQIVSSTFRGNSAPSGAAIGGTGGLFGQGSGWVYLENCLVVGNTGGGHAVHVETGNNIGAYTVDMLNCTVANNSNDGVRGRHTSSDAKTLRVRNSIIVNNGGYGIYKTDAGESDVMSHNNVFGNTSGNYYQVTADANSISVDPQFVNAAGGDYLLAVGSPSRNTAFDYGLAVDLLGNPRPFNAKDTGIDMGCYEMEPPPPGTLILLR